MLFAALKERVSMWCVLRSDFDPFDARMMSVRYLQRDTLRSFLGVGPDRECKIKILKVIWLYYDAPVPVCEIHRNVSAEY